MNRWPIAVIVLTCLLFSGCRTDPRIQLVERDNRRLEDEIYRLRGCLEDYQSGMVATGTEVVGPSSSRRRVREERESSAAPSGSDLPSGASQFNPSSELDTSPGNEMKEMPPPRNSTPPRTPTSAKPGAFQAPRNPRAMPVSEKAGPALGGAAEADVTPPSVPAENMSYIPPQKGDSLKAVQIVLHDRLCTASEKDGLRVVFEPRDRRDQPIAAPARVEIVLIDPTLVPRGSNVTPKEARIAFWDFPAEAVASMFRGMDAGKVISIEAPWPGGVPEQKKLLLFVRYTTRDGRQLVAGNLPIEIKRPEDRTTRLKPPRRLEVAEDEPSGPTLAQEEPPSSSESREAPPADRREPERTASRENAPRLQRPVWSPERR
jgi:hypothetical protein